MEAGDDDTARLPVDRDAEAFRARRAQRRRAQVRRRRFGVGGGVLVLVLGAIVLANVGTDAIPAKVSVGGVDVSGLTEAQAREKLRQTADAALRREIAFTSPADTGLRLSVAGSALASGARIDEAVLTARRSRTRMGRLLARIGIRGPKEIPLRFTLKDNEISQLIRDAQRTLGRPAVSASVAVEGNQIVTTPARAGQAVDRDKLVRRLETLPARITLEMRDAAPEADDADARAAKTLAEQIIATPRTVTYEGASAPLPADVTRRALSFPVRKRAIAVELDADTLREALITPLGITERDPKDARLVIRGDRVVVVQSLPGIRFDAGALTKAIAATPTAPTVAATVTTKRAKFRTRDARALKITERVATFTTPYACCPPRVTNIRRAAQILDGTIIRAGARFSLNDALGERTVARGFVEAPAIAAGELKDSVGGGVSQVATTMYNAAFFAGLELVANTPHEFWISRYPKGREATISWRTPDLVFRNDWDAAILVAVYAGNNGVTVSFYSSKLGRRVETTTGPSTNPTPPKTIERQKPDLPPGTRKVIQTAGSGGFSISYTRKVFAGDTVKRNETFRWNYRPENAIVELGPPKPEEEDEDKDPGEPTDPDAPNDPDSPATPTSPTTPGTGTTPGGSTLTPPTP
jgi:vancomycin resistance protein YoaR